MCALKMCFFTFLIKFSQCSSWLIMAKIVFMTNWDNILFCDMAPNDQEMWMLCSRIFTHQNIQTLNINTIPIVLNMVRAAPPLAKPSYCKTLCADMQKRIAHMLPSNDSSRVRLDGLDAMCQVSGTTFVFLLIEEVHLDLSGVSTWGSCKEEKEQQLLSEQLQINSEFW